MCKLTIEKLFFSYIRNCRGFGDLEINCDFLRLEMNCDNSYRRRQPTVELMIIFLMVNVFNQCENSEAVVSKSC